MIKVFNVKDLIGYLAKIIIVLVAVALVIKVLEIGKKMVKLKLLPIHQVHGFSV